MSLIFPYTIYRIESCKDTERRKIFSFLLAESSLPAAVRGDFIDEAVTIAARAAIVTASSLIIVDGPIAVI